MTDEQREHMRAWLAALRSGEFRQTAGALRKERKDGKEDGYCCLGVACEVYARALVLPAGWSEPDGMNAQIGVWRFMGHDMFLPREVVQWFGLPSSDPDLRVSDDDEWDTASHLNDERGYTFDDLADAIESTFLTGGVA